MSTADELRQLADGKDDALAGLLNRAADELDGPVVDLHDAMDPRPHESAPSVPCRITSDSCGIYLRPKGYGDSDSADGQGCPVMVEFFGGQMRVVIWDDINSEEPQIVSLEGAREDVREEDDDNDSPGDKGDDDG